MALTTTSIKDIFKKKVDSIISDSYEAPTIWVDSRTGEEHEDYDYSCVKSADPDGNSHYWKGKPNDPYWIESGNYGDPDYLVVNGPIKQVGSHVVECGRVHLRNKEYPFANSLDKIFKYARNLEILHFAFEGIQDIVIPENLFWNCPKLTSLFKCFCGVNVTKIPANLLSECHSLENVSLMFYDSRVDEIPEDLFKNNPEIYDFSSAFKFTNVKKIPDGLLTQFKDGIEKRNINILSFVELTPIDNAFRTGPIPPTPAKRKAKRNLYFPSYLSKETQWRMLGHTSRDDYNDF